MISSVRAAARRTAVLAAVPLAIGMVTAGPAVAAPGVTTTDLGTLGGIQTFPSDINVHRDIVGQSETASGDYHAFRWRNGTMTDLGVAPGGTFSVAGDINDNGWVVGYGDTATGSRAFLWRNGVRTDLGTLGGDQVTVAGLNNRGQIIGSGTTAAGELHGFVWYQGRMRDLGTLIPAAINEPGTIVGVPYGTDHVVTWRAGVRTDLGSLGVTQPAIAGINDRGDIAAYGSPDGTGYRAFRYFYGSWQVLPALGGDRAMVTSINARGDVGGLANRTSGGLLGAVVWRNGVPRALAAPSSHVQSVNAKGSASGVVSGADGYAHASVWRPNGSRVDLGVPDADTSAGLLTDSGYVLGTVSTGDERIRGVLWRVPGA